MIQKLIKLANNNPNDNEANLAARKVCKMLADYKFEGDIKVKFPSQKPTTWNDVQRSTEPFWRTSPFENQYYTNQQQQTGEAKYYRAEQERKEREFRNQTQWTYKPFDDSEFRSQIDDLLKHLGYKAPK